MAYHPLSTEMIPTDINIFGVPSTNYAIIKDVCSVENPNASINSASSSPISFAFHVPKSQMLQFRETELQLKARIN